MTPEALLLSRLQFVWVIAWHILLPAFTVGLASFIAFMEGLYFATRRETYLRISSFWTRIFSVSFAMGVVSGIIMPFQFGTNWSEAAFAGNAVKSPKQAASREQTSVNFFCIRNFCCVWLRQRARKIRRRRPK